MTPTLLMVAILLLACISSDSLTPTTLVTAYFPLERSKHNASDYMRWMGYFLSNIRTPIVIFTPPFFMQTLQTLRGNLSVHFVTTYSSPFEIPEMKRYEEQYRTTQYAMDPEASIRGPELYAIWNSKAVLLRNAALFNVFQSEYFFWVDIGYFRKEHAFSNWPSYKRIVSVFRINPDQLLHMVVKAIAPRYLRPSHRNHPIEVNFVEGGFFGGRKAAIDQFTAEFLWHHDAMLADNKFVGNDQAMYNLMAVKRPNSAIAVPAYLPCISIKGDRWFYMIPLLGDAREHDDQALYQKLKQVYAVPFSKLFEDNSTQSLCNRFGQPMNIQ